MIDEADDFLAEHDWEGWGDLSQDERQMVNDWKGTLGEYNEGEIGPGSCNENDEMY